MTDCIMISKNELDYVRFSPLETPRDADWFRCLLRRFASAFRLPPLASAFAPPPCFPPARLLLSPPALSRPHSCSALPSSASAFRSGRRRGQSPLSCAPNHRLEPTMNLCFCTRYTTTDDNKGDEPSPPPSQSPTAAIIVPPPPLSPTAAAIAIAIAQRCCHRHRLILLPLLLTYSPPLTFFDAAAIATTIAHCGRHRHRPLLPPSPTIDRENSGFQGRSKVVMVL